MKIQFLGAAGTVTGSCYCLTAESGQSIMIDCGMFQGTPELEKLNQRSFECDISVLSGMVLTHAHLDHCGRLPRLLRQGFNSPIWMTPPTKDMTEISLFDAAKIGSHDKNKTPLYEKEDVEKIIELFRTVEYGQQFPIGDFSIILRDAGHILGSASLEIIDRSSNKAHQKVIFSGDLGNSPQELIRPTEAIDNGDIVVMESTYGDRVHPIDDPSIVIQSEVNAIESNGGTLLIPAFSIERSQELLHHLYHLKLSGKIKTETPIFFDSPMAERINRVFERYPNYYNEEFKNDLSTGSPFSFVGLHTLERPDDRERVDQTQGAKVIIAGSGMMTGGRILGYAIDYLPNKSTRLFIVGFQAEGTLGRQLLEGEKLVHIQGLPVQVNATVTTTRSMSSHADQPKLLRWLNHIQGVQTVFLLHGEDPSRQELAQKIKQEIDLPDVRLPALDEVSIL